MDYMAPKEGEAMERLAQGPRKGRTAPSNLREYMNPKSWEAYMLPTPTTKNVSGGAVQVNENGKRENSGGTEFSAQLHDLAKSGMLPTPAAQNYKGASSREALEKRGRLKEKADNLSDQFAVSGETSQLSPRFVGEMMGFPVNWTELPFLNGEQSQ